jgi:hypothetical protein
VDATWRGFNSDLMFDGIITDCQLIWVQPAELGTWVQRVAPHICKMAMSTEGRYEPIDIWEAVEAGQMQLWIILAGSDMACVFVTSIVLYPRAKALRFMGCVGHGFRRWIKFLPVVEDWARDQGASIAEAWVAHPKWGHLFHDYKPDHSMLVKAL